MEMVHVWHAVVWRVQLPSESETIINVALNTRDDTWQEGSDRGKQGRIEVSAMLSPNTHITLAKGQSVVVFIPEFHHLFCHCAPPFSPDCCYLGTRHYLGGLDVMLAPTASHMHPASWADA